MNRVPLVVLAALAVAPVPLRAQAATASRVEPELRVDVIAGDRSALQVGGGLQVPFGYYVRVGVDGALGQRFDRSAVGVGGRVDVLTRFLLDPFRQSPFGLSAGAGLGARFEPGARATPLLLVAVDVEGRRGARGWVPALQLGLGGGARIGLVLRRGEPAAR